MLTFITVFSIHCVTGTSFTGIASKITLNVRNNTQIRIQLAYIPLFETVNYE